MTSPQPLDILDLRHFTASQLRPLLEEEAVVWERRLLWEYRSSTELLLQYLDSRILPGFVALYRGRICGYCFSVYEGQKAVVGDIYAGALLTDPTQPASLAVSQTLARHLMEVLEASPDVTRIEAQLLLFDAGTMASCFNAPGLRIFPRLFLEKTVTLAAAGCPSSLPHLPAGIELFPWAATHYHGVAELIQTAYVGHIDSRINDQYCTLAGSLRFLHNVIRFPGCGTFDAEASWVLRQRSTGAIAGVVLCSRVAPHVAHVTQLCIAPELRGAKLGRNLLRVCLNHLPNLGYRALTLTVTEANTAAVRLYVAEGFKTRHRFDAMVLDKSQPKRRFNLISRFTSTRSR